MSSWNIFENARVIKFFTLSWLNIDHDSNISSKDPLLNYSNVFASLYTELKIFMPMPFNDAKRCNNFTVL